MLTIRDRTAMSRRPSIQNAHDAIQRLPSDAASGRTLCSRISLRTGPSSPSYARVIAIASWRSPTWFIQTCAASRRWSARRNHAAAYSTDVSYIQGPGQREGNKPNLRLPSKAYAFFSADVFQRGSRKSFARSRCVAPCSRCQVAMRQRPWRMFFFLRAK